jgi:hypothetical protein
MHRRAVLVLGGQQLLWTEQLGPQNIGWIVLAVCRGRRGRPPHGAAVAAQGWLSV